MLLFDPEARAALLSADRNYAAGDEVFDSHGLGLSWADLVMDHGCVAAVSVSGGGSEESSDNPRYVGGVFVERVWFLVGVDL